APTFQEPRKRFERAQLPAGINPKVGLDALARDLKPYLRGERHLETNGNQLELSAAILIPRHIQDQIIRPKDSSASAPRQSPTPTEAAAEDAIQYWSANATDATQYRSANVTDANSGLREQIEHAVNAEIRRREYLTRGMDAEAIAEVERTYAPF